MEVNSRDIAFILNFLKNLNLNNLLIDLTQGEFSLLIEAYNYMDDFKTSKVNANTLVEKLGVSAPAVSRMLKNLEEKKLIKRSIDLFCRRNIEVSLTEKGKDLLISNLNLVKNALKEALKNLDDKEILAVKKFFLNLKSYQEERKN